MLRPVSSLDHARRACSHLLSWPFFVLLGVYCLGIFSLLLSNRLYIDDIGRALRGYAGWFISARPVAELFAYLFYLSDTTVDASPFSQILALAFLAAAALCLGLSLRARLTAATLLALVPLGLSPYGLENLSYKFDAPQMALALLFAVAPYLFFARYKQTFTYAASLCLFCAASMYQPTLSAYLAVGCHHMLLGVVSRKTPRELLRVFVSLALPFIVGVGLCALQTPYWLGKTRSLYIHHVSAMPSLAELPASIAANCLVYLGIVWEDWGGNSLGFLLALLLLCFGVFLITRWRRNYGRKGFAGLVRLLFLCFFFLCFLLTPIGLVAALPHPVWAPRTFCGFGVVVALMLLTLQRAVAKGKKIKASLYVLNVLLCLQLMIFAQLYGNILTGQERWERTRIAFIVEGISQFIAETGEIRMFFKDSVGLTPLATVPARNYPLLRQLAVVPLVQGWEWGYEQLKLYGVYVQEPPRPLDPAETLTSYLDTTIYRLDRTWDGIGVVSFKACHEKPLWRHIQSAP